MSLRPAIHDDHPPGTEPSPRTVPPPMKQVPVVQNYNHGLPIPQFPAASNTVKPMMPRSAGSTNWRFEQPKTDVEWKAPPSHVAPDNGGDGGGSLLNPDYLQPANNQDYHNYEHEADSIVNTLGKYYMLISFII